MKHITILIALVLSFAGKAYTQTVPRSFVIGSWKLDSFVTDMNGMHNRDTSGIKKSMTFLDDGGFIADNEGEAGQFFMGDCKGKTYIGLIMKTSYEMGSTFEITRIDDARMKLTIKFPMGHMAMYLARNKAVVNKK